jgi:hypothetical protein
MAKARSREKPRFHDDSLRVLHRKGKATLLRGPRTRAQPQCIEVLDGCAGARRTEQIPRGNAWKHARRTFAHTHIEHDVRVALISRDDEHQSSQEVQRGGGTDCTDGQGLDHQVASILRSASIADS